MRLLPEDPDHGWTRVAWLVYLVPFVIYPIAADRPGREVALTFAISLAFLALYFRIYWVGVRGAALCIAGMTALGLMAAPSSPGAVALFIFAAAFVPRLGTPRRAIIGVAIIEASLLLETVIAGLQAGNWIPGVVFVALVGAMNIHFEEVNNKNIKLRLAHEEIERLAQVAERERIARDLHDLLGHTLSMIALKSELAVKLFAADPDRARSEIGEVERIAREALGQVRSAVRGYRSAGLAAEMARTRETLAAAGVEVTVEEAELQIGPAEEGVLALALREATTNVVRHAGARRCSIRLVAGPTERRLEVSDDGRGGVQPDGAGLLGMRERIAALGGTVRRDAANPGTKLVVSLPRHALVEWKSA